MAAGAFPGHLLPQNSLHGLERFVADERRVASGVFDTFERGDTGVVDVSEHGVDVPDLHGLLTHLERRNGGEAALDEFGGEGSDAVLPSRILLECPSDEG